MGIGTPQPPSEHGHTYEVEWTTISYRTITFFVIMALLIVGFILYLIAPTYFGRKAKQLLGAISAGLVETTSTEAASTKREAHFVNIDGTVRVRKANSSEWIRGDYNTNLVKGDYVQTGGDGVARIIFADGTNYVLRPDSLIVVEESREDPVTKATRVAVQINSGTVDLSTGRFEVPGSTSRVKFENAVANLEQDSRAMVHNDPSKNLHELTVQQGGADVSRGPASVRLGQFDQVTFDNEKPGLTRAKVIAPPELSDPPNMALTVAKDPKSANLDFVWRNVSGASAYHLQVSPSGLFSNLVVDKKIPGKNSARISGLEEGTYYWVVTSIDAKGNESQPSAANRFSLVQQVDIGSQAFLDVTEIIQHGRVLEVVGRTEPGSSVIINNEQVFNIASDGTFRHFTSELPRTGANQISVTAQNRKGDTHTIRKTIVIE